MHNYLKHMPKKKADEQGAELYWWSMSSEKMKLDKQLVWVNKAGEKLILGVLWELEAHGDATRCQQWPLLF